MTIPIYTMPSAATGRIFFKAGETRFAVDDTRQDDRQQDGDEGKSVAVGLVQDLSKWGIASFLGWRWYDLDREEGSTGFANINAVTSGMRVKF